MGYRSGLPIPLGVGNPGVSLGFKGLPWFRGGVAVTTPVVTPEQPSGGSWAWLDQFSPRRVRDEDEPLQTKRKRRKPKPTEPADFTLEPWPVEVQTGIVQTAPAWDAFGRLQKAYDEAERIRRKKLRAIALADDDWLMML